MTGPLRRLARPHHRLGLAAAVLTVLALLTLGMASAFPPRPPQFGPRTVAAAPQVNLAALLAITADARSMVADADAAKATNAALPLVAGGLQSASPFVVAGSADFGGADRALQCLALAMYYEAAFEGPGGRLAVAQVVLNRVRHPAFPNSVCAVVFQRSAGNVCQFTFACDGAMNRPRVPALWQQTQAEAAATLSGQVYPPVGMATHYHADYVFPYWAPRLDKIAVVGTHVFYRWPGGWGLRRAFTSAYAGSEPELAGIEPGPANPDPALLPVPEELAGASGEVAPIRSSNEGGFVDPAKGWVPRISQPVNQAATAPVAAATDRP
jgi:spore germination cell wall hydrolase CwlJ-like protein